MKDGQIVFEVRSITTPTELMLVSNLLLSDIELTPEHRKQQTSSMLKSLKRKNVMVLAAFAENSSLIGALSVEIGKDKYTLLNIHVTAAKRRSGIGSALLSKISTLVNAPGRRSRAVIEVRETNLIAQLFLRSCKYRCTGIRHEHYQDPIEDMYFMEYRHTWPMTATEKDKKGAYATVPV